MHKLLGEQFRRKSGIGADGALAQAMHELASLAARPGVSAEAAKLLAALPSVLAEIDASYQQFDRGLEISSAELLEANDRLREDVARRQHALQQSEARLALALTAEDNVIWDWDIARNSIVITSSTSRFLGHPAAFYRDDATRLWSIVEPEDAPVYRARVIDHLQGRTAEFAMEAWMRTANGERRFVQMHGKVVERDATGRALRMAGIAYDVTTRKRAEDALRESEARFRSLSGLSSDWYWEQDDQFRFVTTEGVIDARGGITAADHTHRTRWELPHTFPMDGSWDEHRKALERHEPFRDLLLKRDVPGTPLHYVSVSGVPIFSEDGKFTGYRGIARDVTERVQAEEALKLAKIAAEAASMAKSQFLANMSHEIRTPMNGVLGMAELLLTTALDRKQRHFAETVQRSGEALLHVINDILDFSKIEAGKLTLDLVDFDLREILENVEQLLAVGAASRGLALSCHIAPGTAARVNGDPIRIRQVVTNLLGNALKFTDQGEVELRVRAVAQGADGQVLRFEVRDTGIGISPDAQARLFQPFSQADGSTTRRYGGTGLGLSISRELVGLMGGEIGCNSVLGKGATFWFTARVGAATPVVAVLHANHEAAAPLAACFSGKVLVAEDNAVNQEVVQAVLRGCGCDVRIVGNGREALQAIQHEHFDLVLMDCQMPEMDGYAATRAVRAMQAQGMIRYMPIVALTAHATESDRQLCLDAGMDSVVTKPYTQAALRKELARWLVSSRAVAMTGVTPQNNAASSDVGRENKAIVESKMNANTQGGGLDQSALDELRALDPDGSVGVFNEIIQSYLDESPAIIARMRAALAAANIGDMTNEAHSIKSSSYTVGAMRVGGLAAEIEAKGRANTIDGCHALVADLANQYAQDEKLLHACMAAPQR